MTPHEIELATELDGCGFVGRRFARDMAHLARTNPNAELNLRQRHYMEILAWRYRRQLPEHLVPERKPPDLPKRRKEHKPKPARVADPVEPMPDLFAIRV